MNKVRYILTMLFALIITGCITVDAGKDQVVHSGDKVVLNGSLSRSIDKKEIKYVWKQTQGPKVTLQNANSQKASFIALDVTKNTSLKFLLTVSTIDERSSNTDSITISVNPVQKGDTTPPVITLNGDVNLTLNVGDQYIELGATATDDKDGNVSVDINGSVDTSKSGTYTLTYTAKDKANNTSQKSRVVHVVVTADTTPPVITLNGDANITLKVGGTYKELGATAIDDRDGNVSVEISGSVDTSKAGTYTITYTAKDKANNISKKSRIVHVILPDDTTLPVITLNGDANITMYIGQIYVEENATAIDNEDGNITVSITGDVNSSSVGVYSIVYTAVDSDGHSASKTRYITVIAPPTPSEIAKDFVEAYLSDNDTRMEQITSKKMIAKLRTIDVKVKKYFNLIKHYPSMKYFHNLKALVVGVAIENGKEIQIKFYFNWVGSHWIMTEVL